MNGFRLWALQDLSHLLSTRSLQHESHIPSNTLKHRFWSLLDYPLKEKNLSNTKEINSSKTTVSCDLRCIPRTRMTLPEIVAVILSFRSPARYLHFEANTEKRLNASKLFVKYDDLSSLLNDKVFTNVTLEPKFCKMLRNVQAGDFSIAENGPSVKPKLRRAETNQQSRIQPRSHDIQRSRKRDSSQSRNQNSYRVLDDSFSTEQRIQQKSRVIRCVSHTPTIVSKPSPPAFETLQRSSVTTKTRRFVEAVARPSTKIKVPRNIASEWSSMEQPYLRKKYHVSRKLRIEERAVKDDHGPFASDIRAVQQKRGTCHGTSRFNRSVCSASLGNQGFRGSSSCLPSVPHRVFSSRSCIVVQRPVGTVESTRGNGIPSANVSILALRSSHLGRVSLTKLELFSRDASKKSADCRDSDERNSQGSRCERKSEEPKCSRETARNRCESKKMRRKDSCSRDNVSPEDMCGERRKGESSPRDRSSELQRRIDCDFKREQSPDGKRTVRRCDAKRASSTRDCTRRSRDPTCSQQQDTDMQCDKKRRSRRCDKKEKLEKFSKPRVVCTDPSKGKIDCHRKSKCDESRKREVRGKAGRKCDRGRSRSCQRKDSCRANDKSCRKSGDCSGKRHYSLFSISRDDRSSSALIPDIILGTNANKTTQRLYASCGRKDPGSDPPCGKPKEDCGTERKNETKKKCEKRPAKCLSRKSAVDKTCHSAQRDRDKKPCELSREPSKCSHQEYCANRKKLAMKDDNGKEESMKEKIERELREIEECKKGPKDKGKKNDECKEDRSISDDKGDCSKNSTKKFKSTSNESIFPNLPSIAEKSWNIQSKNVRGVIPIIIRNIRPSNMILDRSLYTTKAYHQDDSAIKRAVDHNGMLRNSASGSDFIHGDELPLFTEAENDEEQAEDHDSAADRSTSEFN